MTEFDPYIFYLLTDAIPGSGDVLLSQCSCTAYQFPSYCLISLRIYYEARAETRKILLEPHNAGTDHRLAAMSQPWSCCEKRGEL
jgi:hypothetical protein